MLNEKTKTKVIDYLEKLKDEGKIYKYGYNEYCGISNVPYIIIDKADGLPTYLIRDDLYMGSQVFKTIFEYADSNRAIEIIDIILDINKKTHTLNMTEALELNHLEKS